MKKIYHLLALVILGAFTFTSCDDFLDMQPTNSGNAEGAVGTVADAQVVINGVMSAMTSSSYYGIFSRILNPIQSYTEIHSVVY